MYNLKMLTCIYKMFKLYTKNIQNVSKKADMYLKIEKGKNKKIKIKIEKMK